MAKGQVRSNREARKPKKDKTKADAPKATGFASQLKNAETAKDGTAKR
ncbi:MAG: hypothetical protein K0M47_06300 [Rhizobium sp.]|jgi:hypothetical protein|nr:hypothetical protein [Rhizobium sp.]